MAESSLREKAARGFLWGGLNNGLVQIIGALFGIVILRHLAPDDYGKISMLMVFPALASILQESGFTAALCNLKEPTHRDYNAVFWFNSLLPPNPQKNLRFKQSRACTQTLWARSPGRFHNVSFPLPFFSQFPSIYYGKKK